MPSLSEYTALAGTPGNGETGKEGVDATPPDSLDSTTLESSTS